jgi:hypothetical protein
MPISRKPAEAYPYVAWFTLSLYIIIPLPYPTLGDALTLIPQLYSRAAYSSNPRQISVEGQYISQISENLIQIVIRFLITFRRFVRNLTNR